MTFKKLLSVAVAGFIALAAGQAFADGHPLRVGVEGAYPPFSWKEPDGTLKGFDIDFANAVCEKLGRECVLIEQDWDGIIPALLAKKYDVIIASMSITEERKKKIDFSNKYYNTPAKMIAKEGTSLMDNNASLSGKRIGVQRGTTHQCYVEKFFPDAELVMYATQEEVFQDLASGRLDAQLSDSIQGLEGFLQTDAGKGYAFLGGDQVDIECMGEGAGISMRKGNDALLTSINNAIEAIRADGTYEKINNAYFAFDIFGG